MDLKHNLDATVTSNSSLYEVPTLTLLLAFEYIACTRRTIHSSTNNNNEIKLIQFVNDAVGLRLYALVLLGEDTVISAIVTVL